MASFRLLTDPPIEDSGFSESIADVQSFPVIIDNQSEEDRVCVCVCARAHTRVHRQNPRRDCGKGTGQNYHNNLRHVMTIFDSCTTDYDTLFM